MALNSGCSGVYESFGGARVGYMDEGLLSFRIKTVQSSEKFSVLQGFENGSVHNSGRGFRWLRV